MEKKKGSEEDGCKGEKNIETEAVIRKGERKADRKRH